jgi:hypothetical protein
MCLALWQAATVSAPAQQIPNGKDWKCDVLYLKNGTTFRGYVEEETPEKIKFWRILQSPGRPTLRFYSTFSPGEVDHIDRVAGPDREILAKRVNGLDPTGRFEQEQMQKLKLDVVPWEGDPRGGLSYACDHFVLVSDAGEEIVRRAAYRLEQVYAAYPSLLRPRCTLSRPTRIILFQSLAEYQKKLAAEGRGLSNPALYDAARNEIWCASDLHRLREELERRHKEHQELQARLHAQESAWNKKYHNRIPLRLLQQLEQDRQKIQRANDENEHAFEKATRKLFQTLYHEAFHAYLANCVYPQKDFDVPRWLNEGLAQIVESAILEAGELRIGHVDPDRLRQVKEALRRDGLVPIADLVHAGPALFLVAHGKDERLSDRVYLTSWALAFYLAFELKCLSSAEMQQYLHCLRGGDPAEALARLVGRPLAEFEPAFKAYLRGLRTDGHGSR